MAKPQRMLNNVERDMVSMLPEYRRDERMGGVIQGPTGVGIRVDTEQTTRVVRWFVGD